MDQALTGYLAEILKTGQKTLRKSTTCDKGPVRERRTRGITIG
jgi:hypothetical protein